MGGVLAIWNDCAPEYSEAYESWYQNEHLPERLSIPGFLLGRRYEAIDAAHQFLTVYNTRSVSVLSSEAYLDRVRDPSRATRAMMSKAFRNMSRTVCECRELGGQARGSVIVTGVSSQTDAADSLMAGIVTASNLPGMVRWEVWVSVDSGLGEPSEEESIRGRDHKIGACFAIEFLRESSGCDYARTLRQRMPALDIGVFRLLSYLQMEAVQ